jgi:FtsP/CotA-like multicopper oxidase with cupredoxin domain
MEEGTPMLMPGQSASYAFTAQPAGTRWYHSHATAGPDGRAPIQANTAFSTSSRSRTTAATTRRYSSPASLEALLRQDAQHPQSTPDNGLEVAYKSASCNGKVLGSGDPVRVRPGQHVLFRLLNASATDDVMVALPGHRSTVVALDGHRSAPSTC